MLTTREQVEAVVSASQQTSPRLGVRLLAAGHITGEALQAALTAQAVGRNPRLGDLLVAMGALSRETLEAVLQEECRPAVLDLFRYPLLSRHLNRLPAEAAWKYQALPVEQVGDVLVLAFAAPPSPSDMAGLRFIVGQPVFALQCAQPELFPQLLKRYYPDVSQTLLASARLKPEAYQALLKPSEGTARQFRQMVASAVNAGASDLHIRPASGGHQVLMRVDGAFQALMVLPTPEGARIVRHVEVLAGIDFSKKDRPREGRLSFSHENRMIDLRISVISGKGGDSAVFRLADPMRQGATLESLGLPTAFRWALDKTLNRPSGLFLVTGPTGSGKTTTLYAFLNTLQKRGLHIVTAEDPVEKTLEGVNQFESPRLQELLPQLLRHDPDVILIGELRNESTVQTAIRAALTGHLVLTSLHANDAVSTVHRLLGLGADVPSLSGCFRGTLSQRLVPRPCSACEGAGCGACMQTGQAGRQLLAELAYPLPSFSGLQSNCSYQDIQKHLHFISGIRLPA